MHILWTGCEINLTCQIPLHAVASLRSHPGGRGLSRTHISLFALPALFAAMPCQASGADGTEAIAAPRDAAASVPSRAAGPDAEDEIVVTAERYGEAKVAAESEFSEDEIAGQGTDSIQDLLARLAPFIDASGEAPIILINGKPAGFDRSILFYPPEALDRLAVLKPEAAAQYGYAPGKRVVNLVLKKSYSDLNVDAGVNGATAGGQYGGNLSVGRVAISGPVRWNVNARVTRDSALRKDARNIPRPAMPFDGTGYVSAIGGGEIDPALSAAAGRLVTMAAIPAGAASGAPALTDFAATADQTDAVDPDAFETLLSARRSASLSLGVTRPVGAFTASLSLNASSNSSNGLRGLPMASVVVPADSPWSPFAGDVLLTRPFAGERPLRNGNRSESLGASLTLNGVIGGWQTSLGLSYDRSWGENLFETGIDLVRMQQLTDAGDRAFNPNGAWDDSLLLGSRNRTKSDNLNVRLQVQKIVAALPAGPLTASFAANLSRGSSESRQSDVNGGSAVVSRAVREQIDGQMSLTAAILRRGVSEIGPLGDLTADLSIGSQTMSKAPVQTRFGAGINWSPLAIVQFRGSIDLVETAPSFDQLDGPIVTTVNRIFDYARGEVAEPVWITGGNPDLGRSRRQSLALNATVRPFGDQTLSLTAGYRQTIAKGGVASFPELTPVIEAAFPERATRDAAGRLVAVDARAINIARDTDTGLNSGLALRLPGRGAAARGEPGADPLQFSLSLNHRWRLTSALLTRPGVAAIDQLADSGQSRHNLSLQVSVGKQGIGASVNGNWASPAQVVNDDRIFRFQPPLTVNLSLFVEPGRLLGTAKQGALTDDLKISFDVQNLFKGYRRVTLDDGSIPLGYSRDEIDPLGRTARVSVRKRF